MALPTAWLAGVARQLRTVRCGPLAAYGLSLRSNADRSLLLTGDIARDPETTLVGAGGVLERCRERGSGSSPARRAAPGAATAAPPQLRAGDGTRYGHHPMPPPH